MSAAPPESTEERFQFAKPDKKGLPTFDWTLTRESISDTVKLIIPNGNTLPIVFVPGIMGSNLKNKDGKVWRLDTTNLLWTKEVEVGLASKYARSKAGPRQKLLHPARVTVDEEGNTPSKIHGTITHKDDYKARWWGEVGEGSYHDFLLWLEEQLNPSNNNPALWHDYRYATSHLSAPPRPGDKPKLFDAAPMLMAGLPQERAEAGSYQALMSDDLMTRSKFRFPVYACGYNWLESNEEAAKLLQTRIKKIIELNNVGYFNCEQVIVVTHSMGGLVTRACVNLAGMATKIAGVVHGVMPATGAAVAYRRCKVGMRDEDSVAGLVLGNDGQKVTAVFAQAPGALQLLPSQDYPANWLKITDPNNKELESLPKSGADGKCDPYTDIYLRKDRWWGLVREEWLSPKDGTPIDWKTFTKNINTAKQFHKDIASTYHPNTYVYYGGESDQPSFEKIHWKMQRGSMASAPAPAQVKSYAPSQVLDDGSNPLHVGQQTEYIQTMDGVVTYDTHHFDLVCAKQDASGDGTVPACSGKVPLTAGKGHVKVQFKLKGFAHEGSYRDKVAQTVSLYAISKICSLAKLPA